MKGNIVIGIILTFVSLGAMQEAFRIFFSSDRDIVENRASLIPMAAIITVALSYATIRYWVKATKRPK